MDPFFTAMNEALDRIYATLPGGKRVPLQELADAREWAKKQGYRFTWHNDPSDAIDCLCVVLDRKGKTIREWFGGTAGAMSRDEKREVESRLAWEQRQDSVFQAEKRADLERDLAEQRQAAAEVRERDAGEA